MSNSSENTSRTQTQTVTDVSAHPVASFFKECGLVHADFPRFRALIEVGEEQFDSTSVYIPLRVPNHSGFVYESFWRIARTLEIPIAGSKKHRKFIELEWAVREQALLEEQDHPALSMISGEIECFSCKSIFVPDVEFDDEQSLSLSCPSCLMKWNIKIDSEFFRETSVQLLNDQYQKDPVTFNRNLGQAQILRSELYFQTHFEQREDGSSLEYLFGEQTGYFQLGPNVGGSFKEFSKSFLNFISLRYYQSGLVGEKTTSKLEETEVFRKSKVQSKPDAQVPPSRSAVPAATASLSRPADAFSQGATVKAFPTTQPETSELDRFKESTTDFIRNARRSPLAPLLASAVAVVFIFSSVGIYLLTKRGDIPDRGFSEISLPTEDVLTDMKSLGDLFPESQNLLKAQVPAEEVADKSPDELVTEAESTAGEAPQEQQQERESLAEESSTVEAPSRPVQVATKPEPAPTPVPQVSEREMERRAMVNTIYRQGAAHLRQSQYLEAVAKFEQVVKMDPQNFAAHLNLGKSHFQIRRLDEAKTAFQSAQSLDAKNSEVYRSLGLVYFYSREFSEAVAAFESYLRLDGDARDREQIEQLLAQMKSTLSNSRSTQSLLQ